MFRAQQNAFDDAIGQQNFPLHIRAIAYSITAKATDENLTSENWEYILVLPPETCKALVGYAKNRQDVCDRVGAEDSGYAEVHMLTSIHFGLSTVVFIELKMRWYR